jgi:hypothetical protein
MNKAQQNRIREYLEWSWNYGIAEEMAENTTKDNGRMISMGIAKGEEQDMSDLVADFINLRCTDGEIDNEWLPETLIDHAPLRKLIKAQMVAVDSLSQTSLGAKHPGAVCSDCGETVTESAYSTGQSGCCGKDVVAEEEYMKNWRSE